MDKIHKADPNANREWFAHEWKFVRENAPLEVLIPCMIARYAGLAGQTIVGLNEKQFLDHPLTGKAVQYTRRKKQQGHAADCHDRAADIPRVAQGPECRWPDRDPPHAQ